MLWHAVNLAVHAACAALLYRLLRRVMPDAAFLAALLFAVHPIQAEPVDYVYARATLLCALFSLLAFSSWIADRDWIPVAWFALAVLSKEESVSLPLVLALYSIRKAELRRRILPLAAMFGIAILAGVRVLAAIHATGMKNIGVNAGISPLGYLSEQGIAILRYIGLLVFPWFFTVDPQLPSPAWAWRALAWLIVAGLIATAALRFRELRAAFWILAGFTLLIPSSSIFPAADLAADRRMYLAMLAFAPAVAAVVPHRSRTLWLAIAGLLTVLSAGRTYVWMSDERLWGEAARLAPDKLRPKIQLARALPHDRAIAILEEAERLAPFDPQVPTELAHVELELNRPAVALSYAGRALALAPHDPHSIGNRGAVLQALGQTAAARRDFLAALAIDPCLAEARANLESTGGIPADAPVCKQPVRY